MALSGVGYHCFWVRKVPGLRSEDAEGPKQKGCKGRAAKERPRFLEALLGSRRVLSVASTTLARVGLGALVQLHHESER